jgi:hypothetical protein
LNEAAGGSDDVEGEADDATGEGVDGALAAASAVKSSFSIVFSFARSSGAV